MKYLGQLIWLELKLFLREPEATFFTLVFPLLMLFVFGSIFGNEPSEFYGGRGNVDVSVPAYMAMIIATTGLLSISVTVASYREKGILRRYRLTPMHPLAILTAQVTVNVLMAVIGALLLVLAAKLVYGFKFTGNIFSFSAGFLLSALSFFSIGFVVASVVRTARIANIVGMSLYFPNLFLSGAAIPKQIFPAGVDRVSHFLPLRYVVELLQGLSGGEPWSEHGFSVLVLVIIGIIGLILTRFTFRWE